MRNYGNKLKELRTENKISQRKMAEILGVTAGTISRYENQEIAPTEESIYKTAKHFGVTSDYLLGLSEKPYGGTPDSIIKELEFLRVRKATLERMVGTLKIAIEEVAYGGDGEF
jgi:transcriptional regulator with XRE-family HTH domain